MLTDREAADIRARKVVGELHGKVNVALRSGRSEGLTLRNTLGPAASEMSRRLIEIYAQLDGASEPPLRDELVEEITRLVTSFIRSVTAGVRGVNVGAAARLAANLIAMHSMAIGTEFNLRAYEARKDKAQSTSPPAPARRKHDKLGILDSPSLYADDFKDGVGVLGIAVIYFDLDKFKDLNTRFTEPVIDRTVLVELNGMINKRVFIALDAVLHEKKSAGAASARYRRCGIPGASTHSHGRWAVEPIAPRTISTTPDAT